MHHQRSFDLPAQLRGFCLFQVSGPWCVRLMFAIFRLTECRGYFPTVLGLSSDGVECGPTSVRLDVAGRTGVGVVTGECATVPRVIDEQIQP